MICVHQKMMLVGLTLQLLLKINKNNGTKPIWDWIDDKGWKNRYPNNNDLLSITQKEVNKSFNQESTGILLRVWEEVSLIFILFTNNSEHSPYKKVGAFFARK